jgi:GNAT superfamily N-acetyltransferase
MSSPLSITLLAKKGGVGKSTTSILRYPTVPAVRVGRLAVDRRLQGRGLGAAFLANAATRTLNANAAAFTLLVYAETDQAVTFYQRFGFRILASKTRTLFLPLATAQKVFLEKHAG